MQTDIVEIIVPSPITVIEIEIATETPIIEVEVPSPTTIIEIIEQGPQGPAGGDISANLSLIFEGALL
ncbi:hypothetical protein [Hoeflea sp.]|uniref:hypothetical protein n=1 Tax=Hoeflea sp. TaxID=1940281 RepID=UPI003B52E3C5